MSTPASNPVGSGKTLTTRRLIAASPERLFEIWTDPSQIQNWWGPSGVDCPFAEVDLREGGKYRIANRLDDGSVIWITGEFEAVEPPNRLIYTWRTDRTPDSIERVTVQFTRRGDQTEVSVVHQLIEDEETLQSHESGWQGCLDGLSEYVSGLATI